MKWRFGLRFLMVFIAVIAIGLGLMRSPSDGAVSACYGIMILALSIALVGAILSRDGGFVGFATFGWLHASLTLIPVDKMLDLPVLPTIGFVDAIVERVIERPVAPIPLPSHLVLADHGYIVFVGDNGWRGPDPEEQKLIDQHLAWEKAMGKISSDVIPNAQRIGYLVMTLLMATIGAMTGRALKRPHVIE
jgi:hypothetical protein